MGTEFPSGACPRKMGRKRRAQFSPTPGQKGGWQGDERTGLVGLEDTLGVTEPLGGEGEQVSVPTLEASCCPNMANSRLL